MSDAFSPDHPVRQGSFAEWAPNVMASLQRIESGNAFIVTKMAVMETKMDSILAWKTGMEAWKESVESRFTALGLLDATRRGMVQGGTLVWKFVYGIAAALFGIIGFLLGGGLPHK